MSELFPPETTAALSPRLQWMKANGIEVTELPTGKFRAHKGMFCHAIAPTEHEALCDLAQVLAIKLWNEETKL